MNQTNQIKTHKPGCKANVNCLVYHPDGICPGPYGQCTCDEIQTTPVTPQTSEKGWEEDWMEKNEVRVVAFIREIGIGNHIPALVRLIRHEARLALSIERSKLLHAIKELAEGLRIGENPKISYENINRDELSKEVELEMLKDMQKFQEGNDTAIDNILSKLEAIN